MRFKTRILLFAFYILGILDSFGQKNNQVIHEKEYKDYSYNLFQNVKSGLYKSFKEHIVLGYRNERLKSALTSDEVREICHCKVIAVQIDPNDPYSQKDSCVCYPFDLKNVRKIYITYLKDEPQYSIGSFSIGLSYDSIGIHKTLFFSNLGSPSPYIPVLYSDFLRDYYILATKDNLESKLAVVDSQSSFWYSNLKFEISNKIIFEAASSGKIKIYQDESLNALISANDIQKNYELANGVNGAISIKEADENGKKGLVGFAVNSLDDKKNSRGPTMLYITNQDAQKILDIKSEGFITPWRYLNLVAGKE